MAVPKGRAWRADPNKRYDQRLHVMLTEELRVGVDALARRRNEAVAVTVRQAIADMLEREGHLGQRALEEAVAS